jgi:hypothetical protein
LFLAFVLKSLPLTSGQQSLESGAVPDRTLRILTLHMNYGLEETRTRKEMLRNCEVIIFTELEKSFVFS